MNYISINIRAHSSLTLKFFKKFSNFFFHHKKEILFIKSREVTFCRAWFEQHINSRDPHSTNRNYFPLSGPKFINSFLSFEIKNSEVQVLGNHSRFISTKILLFLCFWKFKIKIRLSDVSLMECLLFFKVQGSWKPTFWFLQAKSKVQVWPSSVAWLDVYF